MFQWERKILTNDNSQIGIIVIIVIINIVNSSGHSCSKSKKKSKNKSNISNNVNHSNVMMAPTMLILVMININLIRSKDIVMSY